MLGKGGVRNTVSAKEQCKQSHIPMLFVLPHHHWYQTNVPFYPLKLAGRVGSPPPEAHVRKNSFTNKPKES